MTPEASFNKKLRVSRATTFPSMVTCPSAVFALTAAIVSTVLTGAVLVGVLDDVLVDVLLRVLLDDVLVGVLLGLLLDDGVVTPQAANTKTRKEAKVIFFINNRSFPN
jgi:hypothetical protein